jgi:hypothetical protein
MFYFFFKILAKTSQVVFLVSFSYKTFSQNFAGENFSIKGFFGNVWFSFLVKILTTTSKVTVFEIGIFGKVFFFLVLSNV